MAEINRAITEMQAGVIDSTNIFGKVLTSNTPVIDTTSFKKMKTFSLWIVPKLQSGSAPTSITIKFTKLVNGIEAKDAEYTETILATDIISNPKGIIVNVNQLLPESIFTDLRITATSTGTTNVLLDIYAVGN